jgi:hypothetical protein
LPAETLPRVARTFDEGDAVANHGNRSA